MSPVPQSQFIPLTEVICCTISDMNADHIVVTQDALMETLVKHHPGMATPPQDVLYCTLGNLIKERKIYHTGEGYFIVTPRTYFITNNGQNDNKWHVSEDNPPLPPCATYLVSMASSTDFTKGNLPTVSHCPSCHCYSDPLTQNVPEQPHDQKDIKDPKEPTPWVQTCAVVTSVEHTFSEQSKPSASMRQKETCSRKFGLGLFRRNLSKKEKSKKQYTTFAAQFPPEEWPVRDEDNVDNIPRDIEHEIIKRINPVLTVDNLVKHTVLMQKVEQQKKYISKGTSTEVLTARQKHNSKTGVRKKINKTTQHRRKLPVGKEKYPLKNQKEFLVEESLLPHDCLRENLPSHPSCVINSSVTFQKQFKTKVALEGVSHCIYKKRIDNPFQSHPCKGHQSAKSHRVRQNCETRDHRSRKEESSDQRSRSLDSRTRSTANEGKHFCAERLTIESKENNPFPMESVKVDILKYPSSYQDTLEGTSKHFGAYTSDHNLNYVNPPNKMGNRQNKAHMDDDVLARNEKEGIKHPQTSMGTYPYDGPPVLYGLAQKTAAHCHTVGIFDKFRLVEKVTVPRQNGEPKHGVSTATAPACSEPIDAASEGCADDELNFYQKQVEDDVCSSLYLEDNDSDENNAMQHVLHGHMQHMFTGTWDVSNKQVAKTIEIPNSWNHKAISPQYSGEVHRFDQCHVKERNQQSKLQESLNSSECQGLPEEMYLKNETSPSFYEKAEAECILNEHLQVSNILDASIFDYCNGSDMDSQAEVLRKSSNESEEKSACWSSDQQTEGMREHFEKNFKLFNTARHTALPPNPQQKPNNLERTENLSNTGDSGIDSPRTRISLASTNSVILAGLKRRIILPNMDGMNANSKGILSKNTLLQLTPVINV
ncbi:storkhead-box protein 1 isoform X2 [Lissotriton helveticus]